MKRIEIRDLEMNEELDKKALENLTGGRWVLRTFYRRVTRIGFRRITRRYRRIVYVNRTFTQRYRYTSIQRYTRLVWV